MSRAILDPHSVGQPRVEFVASAGRLVHTGPNEWLLNLGVIHAGATLPPVTLDVFALDRLARPTRCCTTLCLPAALSGGQQT